VNTPTAPTLAIATYNYEHGGWGPDGRLNLEPAIDHIAEAVPDLSILYFQEAQHYQRDGKRALNQFARLLRDRFGGTWGAHLALNPHSPLHNAVFYRHDTAHEVQAWPDTRDPDARLAYEGTLWLQIDGLPKDLLVQSVHWRHDSGDVRAEQAGRLGNMIVLPAIAAGDFNCLWPGKNEHHPDWGKLPPHLRYHKTWINPATGEIETDLRASQLSLRQGWVDAGALAGDYTVTTNNPPDAAPCRIDRIMVSPPLAAGIIPGSYRVHIPKTQISDHRLVSVRIDPSHYNEPFHAPWWDEDELFGDETWIGGDTSSNPNTNKGWGPKGQPR
jgi:endonuclease/exonuclease/phosphatase family metal-dependent hydrolase